MKKPPARAATAAASVDVLADRGREALRLNRFKEAMEVFKQLARQDPRPEWTDRLGDAYAGRAHALADKGMFKEAAMVLENTLAPDGTLREPVLYLTCLIRQGQHQKAKQTALRFVSRLPAAEAGRVTELAAALSLAVPARTEMPGSAPAGAEPGHAAQAALTAWLQGKPVRRGRSSARPNSAALAIRAAATDPEKPDHARGRCGKSPQPAGHDPGGVDVLRRPRGGGGDAGGRSRRPARALEPSAAGTAGLRGRNPRPAADRDRAAEPDRRGRAARPGGLFTSAGQAGAAAAGGRTPHRLPQSAAGDPGISPAVRPTVRAALRAGAQPCARAGRRSCADDWRRAQDYWDGVAEALSRQQTPDARLSRAVVLRHLADLAQTTPGVRGGPWTDTAADYLERSLEADPDHLPATLALIEQYRTADSPKDWHRATDLAAKRFPGNTAILLQAVDAAVARSAYKKAVGFARRVLTLDPINQPVRQRMIELQLAYARKQMRSGRADLAGKALSQAAEWERRGCSERAAADRPGTRGDARRAEPGSGRPACARPCNSPAAEPPAGSVRCWRPR